MLHLKNNNFDVEVTSHILVVVDFWAPWCGPCKALGPIIEQISLEVSKDVLVAKVDVDECPELAEKFHIQSIPTIIFLKNGVEIKRSVGLSTKADILAAINSL